jgi:glycosidase
MAFQRIYEINTRVWLWELLAQHVIARPHLADIPEHYIQTWQRWQIDAVWLMGVWEPSPYSAQVSQTDTKIVAACQQALEDWTPADCVSSPYAVRRYEVSDFLGGLDGLLALRQRLRQAGIGLILDFVPNHTACDHPWVHEYPAYYVQGSAADLGRAPDVYFQVSTTNGAAYIAHGRDPYFPPWPDTAQLNYANPDLHRAMQGELLRIAQWCDGVRCDMAMLCLSDVFARTWNHMPPREFWADTIAAVHQHFPDFCCIAEVYWQLEPQLQQLGFTLTYDKAFYDALVGRSPDRLRELVGADRTYLNACLRFLENHDEPCAAARFHDAQQEAAALAILTLPGAVLLHDGQIEGRTSHVPVQLRRRAAEPVRPHLSTFYDWLLSLPKRLGAVFRVLHPHMAWENNHSFRAMLAWTWWDDTQQWLVVINYSDVVAQCRVRLVDMPLPEESLRFRDHKHGIDYDRDRNEVRHQGLYVELQPFDSHVFEIIAASG